MSILRESGQIPIRDMKRINFPFSTKFVLALIGRGPIKIFGRKINTAGPRLRCFKRSLVCACCGLKGSVFFLERHKNNDDWHFNLYGQLPDGTLKLMTRDHWIPISNGGNNGLSNSQTMCIECNRKKGAKLPKEHHGKYKVCIRT